MRPWPGRWRPGRRSARSARQVSRCGPVFQAARRRAFAFELGGQEPALAVEGDGRDRREAACPDHRLVPGHDPVDVGSPRIGRDAAKQADVQGPVRPDRHRSGHGLRLDGDGSRVPQDAGRQLLGDGREASQHRYAPGCGDIQQVVGARVGDDPAAPVSHHIVGVGVVRRLAGDSAETGRRLRMSGRESGGVDDPGLPARDQPERTEGGCKRFGQQAVAAGSTSTGSLGVIGRHPEIELTVEAGSEVTVHPGVPEDADATIEGDAVQLLEALSLRAPRLPIAEKAPVAARGPRRGLRRWHISGCSSLGAIVMRRNPTRALACSMRLP